MIHNKEIVFLISEDDPDDLLIIEKIIAEAGLENLVIEKAGDGEALMMILDRYKKESVPSRAFVLLLDLNLPKKDGRQVIKEMKSDPQWKPIPIVVLTTSSAEEDIHRCYELGANAYFVKPSGYDQFRDVILSITNHWMKHARLPVV